MRIACWSGPRNISTALMRSWSSREDSFVSDEPFYAYYLKERKLKHPMYRKIIDYYPDKYNDVVRGLTSKIPNGKKIWYQKHMAHHLIDLNNIDWIKNFENCILIRHPEDVINSYVKKNTLNNIDELGYPQQYKIIKYLDSIGKKFIVIDSTILLNNPEKILSQWCSSIALEFDISMLQWKKGNHPQDGIWWKHWYDNVITTTHFQKFSKNQNELDQKYQSIYNEALDYYNKLYYFAEQ
ncbi:MAG: sulfotransferase family protein [Candidatus Pelagibacter sp.]|nr:sulfotransferase family protein [Candidatus Pelagibacter sp.]|tara:strand:- start:13205 stop:13921 length:717 start_codon:yes stop_codon:yes gene_type:complete